MAHTQSFSWCSWVVRFQCYKLVCDPVRHISAPSPAITGVAGPWTRRSGQWNRVTGRCAGTCTYTANAQLERGGSVDSVVEHTIATERRERFLDQVIVGDEWRRPRGGGIVVVCDVMSERDVISDVMSESDDVQHRDASHRTRHRDVVALTHFLWPLIPVDARPLLVHTCSQYSTLTLRPRV